MKFATLSMGVALLAVAALITSAEAKAKTPGSTHAGTFVSASAGKMVMTGRNGHQHTHSLAKAVAVTIDGKSGTLAGLKKGMHVSVTTDASGAVTTIATTPAKTAPTAKTTPAAKPAATQVKPASAAK
jgi:hypothetical protein